MSDLPHDQSDAPVRSSDGVLTRKLLARRVRPGVVDVAHSRSLATPRFPLGSDSPLLRRLLARRGVDDTLVASGTLVLVSQGMPEVSVDNPTTTASEHDATAKPVFANGDARGSMPVTGSGRPFARGVVLPGRAGADRVPSSTGFVDASPNTARAPVVALGQAIFVQHVTEPADAPLLRSFTAVAAFARDLPGPAVGSDLSLPPNPVSAESRRTTIRRLRQVQPVEAGSEPVELDRLPLAQPAPDTSESIAMPSDPVIRRDIDRVTSAAPAYHSPTSVPGPIPAPSVGPPASVAAPRQMAESVGRELVRSLRRARERRGIAPWKS